MTLTEDELNEIDKKILDVLIDGRATPTLVKHVLEDTGTEVSRQYINQRMKRLAEHNNIKNVFDTGVYEIMTDPRDG